jgi:hypothetical protein
MISHEWGKDQNLWHKYSSTVYQVMMATVKCRSYAFNFTTRKPWFSSFLVSSDLYNGNHDRHRTLSSGISYQLRHVYVTSCVWNYRTWVILPGDDHNLYLILIIAHILLMFIIRTVRLLEISCCLSRLVCQLTLINIFILVLINYFTIKI